MDIGNIFDMDIRHGDRLWQGFLMLSLENFNPQKSYFDKTINCDQIQHWKYLQCFLLISISLQPFGLHPGLTPPVVGQQGRRCRPRSRWCRWRCSWRRWRIQRWRRRRLGKVISHSKPLRCCVWKRTVPLNNTNFYVNHPPKALREN